MDKDRLTEKRIEELAERCRSRDIPVRTDFMSLNEQDIFVRKVQFTKGVTFRLEGGYDAAERKTGLIIPDYPGYEDWSAYSDEPDEQGIVCLRGEVPKAGQKEELSHRDWLGSIMNLGIDRSKVGDIIPDAGGAWFFCVSAMADYICENLFRVKHTAVRCERGTLPDELAEPEGTEVEFSVSSLRIDSAAAGAFRLSRTKMAELISQEVVYVNGRKITQVSAEVKAGDVISVRHVGRAVLNDCSGRSKKGRLFVSASVYK